QQFDLLQAFPEARQRFIRRDAESPEFVREKRARKSDIEASTRDPVQHGDFTSELERMIEHRQHRAGNQPHVLGALRYGAQENNGIRTIAAVALELVLHSAGVSEAKLFGRLGDG